MDRERPQSHLAPSPWGRRVGDEGVRGRVARSALSWHGGPHRNADSTAGTAEPLFLAKPGPLGHGRTQDIVRRSRRVTDP
jgi:hypothetical protein